MLILLAYRSIPESPGWATGDSVARALRVLGHDVYRYAKVYQRDEWLEKEPPPKRPDLVLWMECNDADPQYMELLEDYPHATKALWEFDTSMHEDFSRNLWPHFDHVFLANARFLAQCPRARYLPYAVDEVLFAPCHQGEKEGCAIIGSAFGQRLEFAQQSGVGLVSGVYRGEYVKALSRLLVSVHFYASGGDGLIVMRPWETMGVGTCLLCQRSETMARHFADGTHYVGFDDAAECKDKAQWLLGDRAAALEIAANGHRLVMERHTYRHRMQELLQVVTG